MYKKDQQWKKQVVDYLNSIEHLKVLEILDKLDPKELNSVDDNNETILHYIANYTNQPDIEVCINIIRRLDKDTIDITSEDGYTALHYAINRWNKDLCEILISNMSLKGLTPSSKNVRLLSRYAEKQPMWDVYDLIKERIEKLEDGLWQEMQVAYNKYYEYPYKTRGFTLLDCTESNHNKAEELIKELLYKTNNCYQTVLDIAVEKDDGERICKLFIEYLTEKDLCSTDYYTETLFHKCARNNQLGILKMIIPKLLSKINNNDLWEEGTALHIAIKRKNYEIAKILIENMTVEGIKLKNRSGHTALELIKFNIAKELELENLINDKCSNEK